MTALLALLLLALLAPAQPNNAPPNEVAASIFGVRWFLGEKFRFQQPVTLVQREEQVSHLLLFFNTLQPWPQLAFSVLIEGKSHSCTLQQVDTKTTASHHKNFNELASNLGEKSTFHIQKCRVFFQDEAFLDQTDSIAYSITANIDSQDILLFASKLRSPSFNGAPIALTVFGDWGVMSNFSKQSQLSQPITECLREEVERRKEIRLMLLLGDLAYDLEGSSYVSFFNYLQPFSSQLALLVTLGNHESIKHRDIFQLVKHSFHSPSWSHFYGYFDMVKLGSHVLLGYASEHLFPWLGRDSNSSLFHQQLQQEFGDFQTLFQLQLSQQTKQRLRSHTVIGYSHYPIFCSEEDQHEQCDNYQQQHLQILSHLMDAGMTLFFSGHLHFYERSRQICRQEGQLQPSPQDGPLYQMNEDCAIFVVEGAAGNNYFVETSQHFALKDHSQRFIKNTGFGVLSLANGESPTHFQHFLAEQSCPVADQMYLLPSGAKVAGNDRLYSVLMIVAALLAIFALLRLQRRRRSQRMLSLSGKSTTNVLEMMEADSLH